MSRRSAAAPRRYTCWIAERGRSVSTWAISRTTRGSAPGTAISDAQISGTSWKPILRAASAGNSAVRSGVAVNRTLITSSVDRSLRAITSVTSSAVPSSIASRSSASICTAPRTALTVICLVLLSPIAPATGHRHRLQAYRRVQLAYFPGGQLARGARLERAEPDRADVGADQPADRVPGRGQHPAHYVLSALVQGDLHQRAGARPVDHAEPVGRGDPVVELDAGRKAAPEVLRHRTGHVGQVGLGDLEAGVGEPVRQLTVVGEQHQALGVVVQPADMEEPLGLVAEEVRDGPPAARVRHRRQHLGRLVEGQVDQARLGRDALAVDPDHLGLRVDPGAEPAHRLAVDLNPAGADHLLAVPATAESGLGQDFLQPGPAGDIGQRVPVLVVVLVLVFAGVTVWRSHPRCPQCSLAGTARDRGDLPG